jgi:mycofactocin precursor
MAEPTIAAPDIEVEAPTMAEGQTDALLVEDELLVEDVSIDGMCGVY